MLEKPLNRNTLLVATMLLWAAVPFGCSSATQETEPSSPTSQPTDDESGEDAPAEASTKDGAVTRACTDPLPAIECSTTSSPPTAIDSIDAFLKENAVALRCASGSKTMAWNLQPLIDLYGDNKMFMLGEVHGTNEIGILSAKILTSLAEKNLVNTFGMELPMDYEELIQTYVDTGSPSEDTVFDGFAENFFGRILPKAARALKQRGVPLTVACVDYPQDPNVPIAAIQEVAKKLAAQKTTVLSTLPAEISYPPTANELTQVDDYYTLLVGKKSNVCAELSADDCEHLYVMLNALWVSAKAGEPEGDSDEWFARRETVIYFNMRQKMGASDRMYLHMGSFHTNKFDSSAGSLMAREYPLTKNKVFSVAPAYGNKSVIWYGEEEVLDAEPLSISRALSDSPPSPLFVSTTRPNAECQGNPLGVELETDVTDSAGKRAEMYDGYIHYGVLTAETDPSKAKIELRSASSEHALNSPLAAYRAAVAAREQAVLGAHR